MGVSSRTNTPSTVVFDECNCSACCWGTPLPPLILQENNVGGNLLIGNNILNGNGAHGVNDNGINTHSPSFSSLLLLSPGNGNNSRQI
uniref:Candidate secreted effector n=1 Tax=Meloidogyne incognita TaxID=6306 RepID=A0A914MD93_MELIC